MQFVDRLDLNRPTHLDDESWTAVATYRDRLSHALTVDDRQATVGAAKELVECIARVVLQVTGATLGDEAKFNATVDAAQRQLGLRPVDLGNTPALRSIAQSALTMVKSVNELRNDVGTGHGRARIPEISDAAHQAAVDAAILWSNWVLRVLEPLLASSARVFIEQLNTPISRVSLSEAMRTADLVSQPAEAQHQMGVAVGQRAGGGFGNAYAVGVTPAEENRSLQDWPAQYRLGLVDGLLIDWSGQIDINEVSAGALIGVLVPVPAQEGVPALGDLADKVKAANWAPHWRDRPAEADAVIAHLIDGSAQLGEAVAEQMSELGRELRASLDRHRS